MKILTMNFYDVIISVLYYLLPGKIAFSETQEENEKWELDLEGLDDSELEEVSLQLYSFILT